MRRRGPWWLSAALGPTGTKFEDDLESDRLPAATTRDGYAEVPRAGPFSVVLRAEKLTGSDVVTRNQAGSIDLGAPRTLWAGVKVRLGNQVTNRED